MIFKKNLLVLMIYNKMEDFSSFCEMFEDILGDSEEEHFYFNQAQLVIKKFKNKDMKSMTCFDETYNLNFEKKSLEPIYNYMIEENLDFLNFPYKDSWELIDLKNDFGISCNVNIIYTKVDESRVTIKIVENLEKYKLYLDKKYSKDINSGKCILVSKISTYPYEYHYEYLFYKESDWNEHHYCRFYEDVIIDNEYTYLLK